MSTMHKLRRKKKSITCIYIRSGNFAGGIVNKAKYIKKTIERDIERGRFMIWPPLGIPPVAKSWARDDTFYEQLSPIDGILLFWPNINTMPLYCELSNSHMFTLESSFAKKNRNSNLG